MKNIYIKIIFFVVFVAFIYYMINRSSQINCNLYNEYKESSFEGVVVKKFIDVDEHSFPFVYVRNYNNNHLEKLNLFYDSSVYKVLHLKDSIVKLKDNPWLYKRNGQRLLKIKIITFACQSISN
jgi:hypothetical protein